jgi:hypothetical protein
LQLFVHAVKPSEKFEELLEKKEGVLVPELVGEGKGETGMEGNSVGRGT